MDSTNLSEATTEWSNVPSGYEVEIQKLTDINLNAVGNESTLSNDTFTFQGNKIVVRPEEALIVIFVLILWIGAIGLFFHRWGKIRNCEPYTPKFEADHRNSCHDQTNLINKRMSMSNKLTTTPGTSVQLTSNPHSFTKGCSFSSSTAYTRTRQNSVFVSPLNMTPTLQSSRRTKSAQDLHSMISEDECEIV
ncbi:hypothetical protein PVAND_012979 [Polypedilum vanderplanki]|uniref:Fibronectin type III domain-containing protein n=1 Tax=Polypedilum vanderplanki TaxID=319348 RepID=A0A9J6CN39_POLVA|nr:hypothetical protein PVAND_012979 [Polypedilum vanderplanki]